LIADGMSQYRGTTFYSTATHFISTSVFNGNVLTATQLKLLAVRLKASIKFRSRSCRLDFTPILHVNLIHFGEVVHIAQENVDLDGFFQA